MTLNDILSLDNSLQIKEAFNENLKASFFSISKTSEVIAETIVFAKNQKFISEIIEQVNEKKINSLCIVTKPSVDLPESLPGEVSVLTTNVLEKVMCKASRVFYDKQKANEQYLADGRQLGTVEIDPTSEVAPGVFIGERVILREGVKVLPGSVIMNDVEIGKIPQSSHELPSIQKLKLVKII